MPANFTNGFDAHSSFPMEIDDAPMMMTNSDFNSNFNSALTSFDFNDLKPTCDNRLVQDRISENEQHFTSNNKATTNDTTHNNKHDLSVVTKSKNGLIGNFDQNFFDTLKNNNINNNLNQHLANTNDMFSLTNDPKMSSRDEKQHLSNNLNHSQNFELFSGIPMDFESIIPYDSMLLNEENMMMACEDSNLLCNL